MKLESYEVEMAKSGLVFEFVSHGTKGSIYKLVRYTEMEIKGIYNLGFGDTVPGTGELDDRVRSDNGDAEKVLATVVQTVLAFTTLRPHAVIYAKGSTAARTRLYQMGISKYREEIFENFRVFGFIENNWERFKLGRRYEAFLAERIKI